MTTEIPRISVDDRIACIGNPNLVCPARQELVRIYDEPVDPAIASQLPEIVQQSHNGPKLHVKLAEQGIQARIRGCEGPQLSPERSADAGRDVPVCPTREAMDQSKVRTSFVSWLRSTGIIGKVFKGSN